mmetsp:Transcript_88365/g.253109  ORF Transcript_88365/g.253109 Transcript_88365/m.253109 type:complete len:201 (+) Transcript_88365:224-826(+)
MVLPSSWLPEFPCICPEPPRCLQSSRGISQISQWGSNEEFVNVLATRCQGPESSASTTGKPGSVSTRPGSTNSSAEVRLKVLRRIPSPASNTTETRPSACTAVTCPSNHASSERQKTRTASPTWTVTSSPNWRSTDRSTSDASPRELTDQREGWPLSLSSSSSPSSSSTCGVLAKPLGICDASASCIRPGIERRCVHGRR